MHVEPTNLRGVNIVRSEAVSDERGSFCSLYDSEILARAGIVFAPLQGGLSVNLKVGTLRGLHYQKPPAVQAKLVRCLRGRLFDVVLDIRACSPTFGQWYGRELAEDDGCAIFIPAGLAHGFLTLRDDTEVLYELGANEKSGLAAGIRWNDPRFKIAWPAEPMVLNARDATWPDY